MTVMIRFQRVSVLLCVPLLLCAASWQAREVDDVRYLVIRRAGAPEKNYYELAKDVVIVDAPPKFIPWMDVWTKQPEGIRYGVHGIWKVRVLRVTDSRKDSVSANNGVYVLIYERDPDVRFCAIGYEVGSLPSGGRQIKYTDCEDKKQYSFEMTKQWPRPFVIYDVEVLDRDALHDVWQRQARSHTSGKDTAK